MPGRSRSTGEYHIDDPEELSQHKRIQELLERRKAVIDARDQSFDAELLGDVGHAEAVSFYRSRIESLIIDLWTKFVSETPERDGLTDGGQMPSQNEQLGSDYLENRVIDEIDVPPPDELLPSRNGDLAPGADVPGAKTVKIQGLKWFIENDGPIRVPFTAELYDPPGEKTIVREVPVPRRTLDRALLACIEFLDEVGIDADLTEQEQQTYITRELLEEVDEWRRNNIDNNDDTQN